MAGRGSAGGAACRVEQHKIEQCRAEIVRAAHPLHQVGGAAGRGVQLNPAQRVEALRVAHLLVMERQRAERVDEIGQEVALGVAVPGGLEDLQAVVGILHRVRADGVEIGGDEVLPERVVVEHHLWA